MSASSPTRRINPASLRTIFDSHPINHEMVTTASKAASKLVESVRPYVTHHASPAEFQELCQRFSPMVQTLFAIYDKGMTRNIKLSHAREVEVDGTRLTTDHLECDVDLKLTPRQQESLLLYAAPKRHCINELGTLDISRSRVLRAGNQIWLSYKFVDIEI